MLHKKVRNAVILITLFTLALTALAAWYVL